MLTLLLDPPVTMTKRATGPVHPSTYPSCSPKFDHRAPVRASLGVIPHVESVTVTPSVSSVMVERADELSLTTGTSRAH
jgi:hypothetical protein